MKDLTTKQVLDHITFWHDKTDEDCVKLATTSEGLDALKALTNIVERDMAIELFNTITEKEELTIK